LPYSFVVVAAINMGWELRDTSPSPNSNLVEGWSWVLELSRSDERKVRRPIDRFRGRCT